MKIIDTTTFFEEHLMMDLRFNILDPFVDKFVVCEARFSHSGKEKEIKFNKKDYPKFEEKILHIIIDDDPVEKNLSKQASPSVLRLNSIQRIEAQRNHIAKALANEDRENYIIYSDNDEIPNLRNFDFNTNKSKIVIFKQKLFYYKFNLAYPKIDWFGSKCCKLKDLQSITWLRNIKNKKYNFLRIDTFFSNSKYSDLNIVNEGGWHFTNLKSPEELLKKYLNDEMHSEFETKLTTINDIEDKIKNRYINYDHLADQKTSAEKKQDNKFELTKVEVNVLPDYIVNNLDQYKSWID